MFFTPETFFIVPVKLAFLPFVSERLIVPRRFPDWLFSLTWIVPAPLLLTFTVMDARPLSKLTPLTFVKSPFEILSTHATPSPLPETPIPLWVNMVSA